MQFLFRKQAGQVMVATVLLVGLGALTTGAGLAVVSTSTRTSTNVRDDLVSYYTAAAGIESVMSDLILGVDALSGVYTPPATTVNGISPTVTVSAPEGNASPATHYRYIDPGVSTTLAALGPGQTHTVRLFNAEPFSVVFTNWIVTTDSSAKAEITIFDASGTELRKGVSDNFNSSAGQVTVFVDIQLNHHTEYTVVFANTGNDGSLFAQPFSSIGGAGNTWLHAKAAGTPYVITSTADAGTGPVTIKAFVRQIPGAHSDNQLIEHMVVVESWRRMDAE